LKLRFFIDYRYDEALNGFRPIGVWMHNPVDGDVDIYYFDSECPEATAANWVLNRLVEGGIKTPDDFLDYHQQRAGYRGMRGPVKESDTELNYDRFARQVMQQTVERDANAAD